MVVCLPYLISKKLSSRLSKGLGHNSYGEPAWPNDILYIFPVVILGVVHLLIGLALTSRNGVEEPAEAFSTPSEIWPEWYFLPTFNLLRVLSSKVSRVLSMVGLTISLVLIVRFQEILNDYQNPVRKPISMTSFLSSLMIMLGLAIGSLELITEAIPLL